MAAPANSKKVIRYLVHYTLHSQHLQANWFDFTGQIYVTNQKYSMKPSENNIISYNDYWVTGTANQTALS